MKIEIIKDKLQKGLSITERVVGKNLSLPVLNNILIKVENNQIILRATNLEIGVEYKIKAKTEGEGVWIINPIVLSNFLNNLNTEDKIIIEDINDNLSISTKNNKTLLKTISDEFPELPKINSDLILKIDKNILLEGIKKVSYAASLSDIKPEISSVYIYNQNNNLYFVATDSFRLSEFSVFIDNLLEDKGLIVPIKNIIELFRILNLIDEEIELLIDNNQLGIKSDDFYFVSRVINGVYPDYQQIIPKEFISSIVLNKEELINTLKLHNVFSDKFNKINLSFDGDNLSFESKNDDIGETNTLIKVLEKEGLPFNININGRYLLDLLSSIDNNKVFIGFTDSNKPLLIKYSNNKNNFNGLVMPLNR